MKKLFITIAAVLLGAAIASAQDLASVTETYNYGANSIAEGNKTEALQAFREALAGAELLGAEGEEIATKCKTYIPELEFSIAKELVNNQDYVMESVVVERGGKLVALVFPDEQAIAKALLDAEAKAEIPENIRLGANRQLPGYSQIAKVELMDKPFEKTPKMSIRRFLYK